MKKIIFFALALVSMSVSAQTSVFNKGDQSLSLGIGFGSSLGGSMTLPPLSINYEKCIVDNVIEKGVIGIGAYLGVAASKEEVTVLTYSIETSSFYTIVGATGSFHYPFVEKLDTYSTLMMGLSLASVSVGDISETQTNFEFNWCIGAKYYFNENFGAFAELGYGIAIFNLGAVYKF